VNDPLGVSRFSHLPIPEAVE